MRSVGERDKYPIVVLLSYCSGCKIPTQAHVRYSTDCRTWTFVHQLAFSSTTFRHKTPRQSGERTPGAQKPKTKPGCRCWSKVCQNKITVQMQAEPALPTQRNALPQLLLLQGRWASFTPHVGRGRSPPGLRLKALWIWLRTSLPYGAAHHLQITSAGHAGCCKPERHERFYRVSFLFSQYTMFMGTIKQLLVPVVNRINTFYLQPLSIPHLPPQLTSHYRQSSGSENRHNPL